MTTATTTNTLAPTKYRKTGACPHCGAPIYADASLMKGKSDVLAGLPQPYYTCMCRFNAQFQPPVYIPVPLPTQPIPSAAPWQPNTLPGFPAGDPHWTICVRPKPSETQCAGPTVTPCGGGTFIPMQPPDFDYRPFTGAGGTCSSVVPPGVILNSLHQRY